MNDNNTSKKIAKKRLQSLVNYDRIECAPDIIDMIKSDLIDVISRYIDIDEQHVNIQIQKPGGKQNPSNFPVISTSIPVSYRREVKNLKED